MTGIQFKYHAGVLTEDRRHDRCDAHIRARLLLASGELVEAFVMNVSKSGFMAETAAGARIGEPIELEVPRCLPLRARVIWCAEGKLGCEFERILSWDDFTAICGHAEPRPGGRLFRGVSG